MSSILVVYYSRTGATRAVAEQLARRLHADLGQIEDPRSRSGALGFVRSAFEAVVKRETKIIAPDVVLHRYDKVVLATPVWAGNVASPMRTWLNLVGHALPDVALVCTYGGSGAAAALEELARLVGKAPLAQLGLREADIRGARCAGALDDFANAIRVASGDALPSALPA